MRITAEFQFAEKALKSGARLPTMRRRSYPSKKYVGQPSLSALYVGSNDYLVLQHEGYERPQGQDSVNVGGKVVMSYPHLPLFQDGVAEVMADLASGYFKRIKGTNDFQLEGDPGPIPIEDLHGGAVLEFLPVIIPSSEDSFVGLPGVRMFLNSHEHFSDCTVANFRAFDRFYQNFDLFATARAAAVLNHAEGGVAGTSVSKWGVSAPQPARRNR